MKKFFIFTRHCKERFIQRRHGKFRHLLENCKNPDCEKCKICKDRLYDYINKNKILIDFQLNDAINGGTEERSFKNNTQFTTDYCDRHGVDHNVMFIYSDDLIFVVIPENGIYSVRTCVNAKGHVTSSVTMRPKFKKKPVANDL